MSDQDRERRTTSNGAPNGDREEQVLSEAERAVEEAEQRFAEGAEEPRPLGILVVEDDPDLQWKLARMLTVRGNRVVGTGSAEAALELLSRWPVDLVLVDDELPGMSGKELARELHRDHPQTPVVLMSSAHRSGLIPSSRVAGVVACFAKPLGVDALVEILRSFARMDLGASPAE